MLARILRRLSLVWLGLWAIIIVVAYATGGAPNEVAYGAALIPVALGYALAWVVSPPE
jgi:hypothetical protein